MGRVNGERARCERDGADDVICVLVLLCASWTRETRPIQSQNKSESESESESQY